MHFQRLTAEEQRFESLCPLPAKLLRRPQFPLSPLPPHSRLSVRKSYFREFNRRVICISAITSAQCVIGWTCRFRSTSLLHLILRHDTVRLIVVRALLSDALSSESVGKVLLKAVCRAFMSVDEGAMSRGVFVKCHAIWTCRGNIFWVQERS